MFEHINIKDIIILHLGELLYKFRKELIIIIKKILLAFKKKLKSVKIEQPESEDMSDIKELEITINESFMQKRELKE